MTPAIKYLQRHNVEYSIREYAHRRDNTTDHHSYGIEAASALNQNPDQVFKTLLVVLDKLQKKPVVAVVPVSAQLDLKKTATLFGARKAAMADPAIAQRVTGYLVGGISPLGQRQSLRSCLDVSALSFETIFVSGGRRGLELELAPQALIELTDSQLADVQKSK